MKTKSRLFQLAKLGKLDFTDRSKTEFQIVTSLFRNGYSGIEIQNLINENSDIFPKINTRKNDYLDKLINAAYKSASLKIANWPIPKFSGRTRHTDRAIYTALMDIANRCNNLSIGVSVRHLAELANIESVITVSRCLKRLADLGVINREQNIITLVSQMIHYDTVPECIIWETEINNPLYSKRGLGYIGHLILSQLDTVNYSEAKTIYLGRMSKAAFSKKIRQLQRLINPQTGEIISIVEKNGLGQYRKLDFDPDEISKFLGVADVCEKRHKKFEHDRFLYRNRRYIK